MTDFKSLLESGLSGFSLNMDSTMVRALVEYIIEKIKEELIPVAVSVHKENLISKREVLEKFHICPTTLWNWEKSNKLIPVRIGRKVSYRQADIERIIIERGG